MGRTFDFVACKFPRIGSTVSESLGAATERMLERILMGLAYIYPEIGYCQGMNFIGGVLLFVMEDEELAFWLFATIIRQMEMLPLFMNVHNIILIILII